MSVFLPQMDELIAEIRDVFITNLNGLSWMDSATKNAAAQKVRDDVLRQDLWSLSNIWYQIIMAHLSNDINSALGSRYPAVLAQICLLFPQALSISEKIGYSENIMDDGYLNKEYEDVSYLLCSEVTSQVF